MESQTQLNPTPAAPDLRRALEPGLRRARDLAEASCPGQAWAACQRPLLLRLLQVHGLDRHLESGPEPARAWAERNLPQLFTGADPADPDLTRALTTILADLPAPALRSEDCLGWIYQVWQGPGRDAVNAAGGKIGAAELATMTQLFSDPYMGRFLLHNSLGAWWAGKVLAVDGHPRSEAEWRDRCQLPGYHFDQLRLSEHGQPLAGAHPQWPRQARDLKVIDPCLGSGRLLLQALPILARFRMVEEGLELGPALRAVLVDNLFGLELDPVCCQLAAFSLALAVWAQTGFQPLPPPQVACCGLRPRPSPRPWRSLAGQQRIRAGLDRLQTLFQRAPILGSLLDPVRATRACPEALALLPQALAEPEPGPGAVAAGGLTLAADLLSRRYTLVLSNVPFLTRGRQSPELQAHCDRHHPLAKGDLATVFLDRMLSLAEPDATVQVVMPQNWLFLRGHSRQRRDLLARARWMLLARLGSGAFAGIPGEVVNVILLTLDHGPAAPGHMLRTLDAAQAEDKPAALCQSPVLTLDQSRLLDQPEARIGLAAPSQTPLLATLAQGVHGFGSKDSARFFRAFWELPRLDPDWQLLQTTVPATTPFGGNHLMVRWQNGTGLLAELGRKGLALPAGRMAWGRQGVAISQMGDLPATLHLGALFDKNVAVIVPADPAHLPAIWCFCASPGFHLAVRQLDTSLKVTNTTLVQVPFDLDHWRQEAERRYPQGLPTPLSHDPTQWLFHGHPQPSTRPLQVAMARLLGYRWPAETDPSLELAAEGRAWVARSAGLGDAGSGILALDQAPDRLRRLLAEAYGPAWSPALEAALLEAEAGPGQTLEGWLCRRFAAQHGQLFQQRPFIWHLGDAHPAGFSALVNYHRFDRAALEALQGPYLDAWLEGPGRAQGARRQRALELRRSLQAVLAGEPPLDLFVRWKPLEQQPIGWNPDLHDGVRINLRPLVLAGILAHVPRLTWGKDRGRDSDQVPRFLPLAGERRNDLHLSRKEKLEARAAGYSSGTE